MVLDWDCFGLIDAIAWSIFESVVGTRSPYSQTPCVCICLSLSLSLSLCLSFQLEQKREHHFHNSFPQFYSVCITIATAPDVLSKPQTHCCRFGWIMQWFASCYFTDITLFELAVILVFCNVNGLRVQSTILSSKQASFGARDSILSQSLSLSLSSAASSWPSCL